MGNPQKGPDDGRIRWCNLYKEINGKRMDTPK